MLGFTSGESGVIQPWLRLTDSDSNYASLHSISNPALLESLKHKNKSISLWSNYLRNWWRTHLNIHLVIHPTFDGRGRKSCDSDAVCWHRRRRRQHQRHSWGFPLALRTSFSISWNKLLLPQKSVQTPWNMHMSSKLHSSYLDGVHIDPP